MAGLASWSAAPAGLKRYRFRVEARVHRPEEEEVAELQAA